MPLDAITHLYHYVKYSVLWT